MDDLAVIDRFTETFSRYIDSGFGLLSGDVAFLTSILVALDITLAGIFWAMRGEENVLAQLIRKTLYVGFFAFLLNNFKSLADIVFSSFASLGPKASGAALTAADLMRPGFVAATGFKAGRLGPLAVIAVSGFASIGWMAITNFVIDSDFKWILLAFALPWVTALVLSWVGTRKFPQ